VHPLRAPGDLAHHVRLDYETIRDGRRLSEWNFWFDAMKIRPVKPASTLQFPQLDQTVTAAIEGSGVAMAPLPHLGEYLRDRVLCAPFGRELMADRGNFYVVTRSGGGERDSVQRFVAWLRSEVRSGREPRRGRSRT
jgi:DNA-binding transcriptional LysR family regulator